MRLMLECRFLALSNVRGPDDDILELHVCSKYQDVNVEINIRLEKFTELDFDDYFQLIGDDRVMAMITGRALSPDEARVRFERLLGYNQLNAHLGAFKILEASTNAFIGLAKLEIRNSSDEEAELGYAIRPDYWGKRVASTAVQKLIDIARNQTDISMLYANIDPGNVASRRILVNNGFVTREFRDFDGLPGEVLELEL